MNREEAKRCTVKIRAAFVSIKEQMRHKGEVPIGRANSIGSRSEPILPPRTRKKKRIEDTCLRSPISKLPQKSPPTRYKFIAFLRNISLPEFHSSFPLPWYKNTYIHISFVTLRGEGISFYTAIFLSSFSKVGLIFQSWILLPPLFFLASSIPPFNSKPPRNLLFIHTPSEKLFIAFTSRNLPLSLSLHASPQNLVEILSPRCKCAHSVPKILRFPTFATYMKPRQNQNFYFPRNCTARLSPQSALSF